MTLQCGIVGLPNVGKSTLFNALTKAGIAAENYPFCTIEPNGDERLDFLEDPYRLFRCHGIMNCVEVCPKGLNPTAAIGKIKSLLVKRAL